MDYLVFQHDRSFVDRHPETYEMYVLMCSSDFEGIFGKNIKEVCSIYRDGFVKIKSGKNTIYRRYKGKGPQFSGHLSLGYRSVQALQLDSELEKVTVKKSWWFPYLWNCYDAAVKHAFRFGAISLALAIALPATQMILKYFFNI